jgi:DNA (cytosine-5)-methyltransferase 1
LKHHYPDVQNFGDFTKIEASDVGTVDLLVGGTPCQDFSVAGLRAGIAGDRGRLTVEYCHLAGRLRPRWLVWENVPGVLSADDGNAFGIFLGALAELGYGTAYRVLDAQHFGVPQRRRRVFVIGYSGDWRPSAAVLFESASLSGHPAPRKGAGQIAPTIAASGAGTERTGNARTESELIVALTLNAKGGTGRNNPDETYVAFQQNSRSEVRDLCGVAGAVTAEPGMQCQNFLASQSAVRRLTPRECERLQGFPDDYTLVPYRGKPASDGPRYRALGNSMAVPCMSWIGQRIAMVESLVAA